MSSQALDSAKELALALSESERAELARALLANLDGPPDPDVAEQWEAEIVRRIRQIDAGTATFLTVGEVRERIRNRMAQT